MPSRMVSKSGTSEQRLPAREVIVEHWTGYHTLVLVLSSLAILSNWILRRLEDDPKSPYTKALRRFRLALVIGGIAGLVGLIRLILMD